MKRAVWVAAMVAVLLVIAFVTLVHWSQPHGYMPEQEHMTLHVTDTPEEVT